MDSHGVACPFCGGRFPRFLPHRRVPGLEEKKVIGAGYRSNAICPWCGSLDRERLIYLYLRRETNVFTASLNVLHAAPERRLQKALQACANLVYVTIDLQWGLAMVTMDVMHLGFADSFFDLIICNHVLEHVYGDHQAILELYRVLRPGGWAILQVPISLSLTQTHEDPIVRDPDERERLFGQHDHVRLYARDYPLRLREAGFHVQVRSYAQEIIANSADNYGLIENESLYIALRPLDEFHHCRAYPVGASEKQDSDHRGSTVSLAGRTTPNWRGIHKRPRSLSCRTGRCEASVPLTLPSHNKVVGVVGMSMSILQEVTSLLSDLYRTEWQSPRVSGLWLQELYTVAELNNGQVGVALNYDNEGFIQYRRQYDPVATAHKLLAAAKTAPVLVRTLLGRSDLTLCERSALCAILEALSRPFMEPAKLQERGYKVTDGSISLDSIARMGDTIHIVGFGGYLEQALASAMFSQVYVSDLSYGLPEGKEMIERELEAHRRTMRAQSLHVYDGQNCAEYLRRSDIVIITGSALCSGTMEKLLDAASNAREVVIYGHSGTLLPSVYFRRGVTRLCWSVIPPTFLERFRARLERQDEQGSFAAFIDSELAESFTIHSPYVRTASAAATISIPFQTSRGEGQQYGSVSHRAVSSQGQEESSLEQGVYALDRTAHVDARPPISNTEAMLRVAAGYNLQGRLDWAEYYYTRALEIASCSGDWRTAAECTHRLGLIYLDNDHENRGRAWLEHSLDLWIALGEPGRPADVPNRLSRSPSTPVLATQDSNELAAPGAMNTARGAKVTVLVSVLNEEKKIKNLCVSLTQQTCQDFEVLVLDNGSTDRTVEIASEYFKVYHGPGRGPDELRNFGIEHTRAEYLLFTDGDCVVDRKWVEQMVASLESGYDGVAGKTKTIPFSKNPLCKVMTQRHGIARVYQTPWHTQYCFPTCNVGYRRDLLKALGGFPTDVHTGGDLAFSMLLGKLDYRCTLNESAVVFHYPAPGYSNLIRRFIRDGRGYQRLRWYNILPLVLRVGLTPMYFVMSLLRRLSLMDVSRENWYEEIIITPVVDSIEYALYAYGALLETLSSVNLWLSESIGEHKAWSQRL